MELILMMIPIKWKHSHAAAKASFVVIPQRRGKHQNLLVQRTIEWLHIRLGKNPMHFIFSGMHIFSQDRWMIDRACITNCIEIYKKRKFSVDVINWYMHIDNLSWWIFHSMFLCIIFLENYSSGQNVNPIILAQMQLKL